MHPNPRQRTRRPYRAKGKMHTNERDNRRLDGPDLRQCRTLSLSSAHCSRQDRCGSSVRTHGRDVRGTQDEGKAQAEQGGAEALEEHEGERDGGQRRAVHVFDLRTALEREQVRELRLQVGREDILVRLDGALRVRVWVWVWVRRHPLRRLCCRRRG